MPPSKTSRPTKPKVGLDRQELVTDNIIYFFVALLRRGVRVAEGARLESVYARKGIAGSNPALSASQAAAIAAFFVLSRCHSFRMSSGRETKKE